MEVHIQALLNRISLLSAAVATLSLFYLFLHSSLSCRPLDQRHHDSLALTFSRTPFPRSSCESAARRPVTPEKRAERIRSTGEWRRRFDSSASLFASLRARSLINNSSRVLCVSAGAGHDVAALRESGVADVTGVDVVDVPPLVRRCDPHSLPFFDEVFDLGFSAGLDDALFPARFVAEMERTVRRGGAIVLAVARCSSEDEVREVRGLFKRSVFLGVNDVMLMGSKMTVVTMRRNATHA